MLPDLTHLSQQSLSYQPAKVLVGLDDLESYLLLDLSGQAQAVAPRLSSVFIQRLKGSNLKPDNHFLALYLQDWFLQLFQCRSEALLAQGEAEPQIPLTVFLTNLDLILAYGSEVTQKSLDPEAAARAFYKALTLKISGERLLWQVDAAQHFYEMMLLD